MKTTYALPARNHRPSNSGLAEALFALSEQEEPGDRRVALLKLDGDGANEANGRSTLLRSTADRLSEGLRARMHAAPCAHTHLLSRLAFEGGDAMVTSLAMVCALQ